MSDKEKKFVEEPQKKYRTLEEMRESQEKYMNRHRGGDGNNQPLTEEQKAYYRKIEAANQSQADYSINSLIASITNQPKKRNIIPYPVAISDCHLLFKEIIARELSTNQRQFIDENDNREKFTELIKYFSGNPSKLNPNKGIYLYGPVGRGKTLIMQSIMIMCNTIEKKLEAAALNYTTQKFYLKNAKTIVNELAENKKHETLKRYYTGILCIDDLGAEEGYKLYGNDLNVVGDIIIERYQRYQQSGQLTHATSNTMPEEWKAKYGDRVDSRLHEMFNVVKLLGEDKRKLS